jgi:hypothetical protein
MRRHLTLLVITALVAGCQEGPGTAGGRVAVTSDAERTWVENGDRRYPLANLDGERVAVLARALFPEVSVAEEGGAAWRIELDSEESAAAFLEAARWTDGIVAADQSLADRTGGAALTDAAVIAENIRRFVLAGDPAAAPDWVAVSRALENDSVWRTTPNTAGMGEVILSGLLLSA